MQQLWLICIDVHDPLVDQQYVVPNGCKIVGNNCICLSTNINST